MPKKKKDNSDLCDCPKQQESYMILEVRQKHRRVADTFDQLRSEYKDYVSKYGKTWLVGD